MGLLDSMFGGGTNLALALDNTTAAKWLSFAPEGTYYEMRFLDNQPRLVDGYTISSANDATP